MVFLGVETSTQKGSLALFKNRKLLGSLEWSRSGSHSEFITTSFQELLSSQKLNIREIKRIGVGIGPGSFTGIRVGINFSRTLAQSMGLPVYNMNSLHLLASQALPSKFLQSKLDIRIAQYGFRNLIYTAVYSLDEGRIFEKEAPSAVTVSDLLERINSPTLIVGSGFDLIFTSSSSVKKPFLMRNPDLSDVPHAQFFSNTPALDESPAHLTDWIHTIPLYVRASEAEEKLRTNV
jgi:tRNA threonylcarbamoyladenosine biosynthesis protein TsaB